MNLKESKTAENLLKSFAGESQARGRYTMYSSIAKKEGYVQISNIFKETADNEFEHSKVFFNHLINNGINGEKIMIHADYPSAKGTTLDNLKSAAAGENEEWSEAYPSFAKIAEEEGFTAIAESFRKISEVEKRHEARFLKLAGNIESGNVFKKDNLVLWKCNNCGFIFEGEEAPEKCPSCYHDRAYFEIFVETY